MKLVLEDLLIFMIRSYPEIQKLYYLFHQLDLAHNAPNEIVSKYGVELILQKQIFIKI